MTLSCQFNSTGFTGGSSNLLGIATVPNTQQESVPILGTLNITSGNANTSLSCTAGGATPEVGWLAIKVDTLN